MVAAIGSLCSVLPAAASSPGSVSVAAHLPAPHSVCAVLGFIDDRPIEQQIGTVAKNLFRQVRWSFRMLRWMFWRAVDRWGRWLRHLAFPLAVVIVGALADRSLIAAWRADGVRPLFTYSLLMLYVYSRLLFSRGVHIAPKLLLLGAVIYGVVRRDLVPDRSLWPGRVEDMLFLIIATRVFVYACPEELVSEYAERAVTLKRRMVGAR